MINVFSWFLKVELNIHSHSLNQHHQSLIEKYSTETEITPPPPLPPVGVNEECVPDCGENAICKVQKSS